MDENSFSMGRNLEQALGASPVGDPGCVRNGPVALPSLLKVHTGKIIKHKTRSP